MAKKKTPKPPSSARSRSSAKRRPTAPKKRPEYVAGYEWDADSAERPIKFIEQLCRHPDELGGSPTKIELIEWQRELLRTLFGWRRPDGRLRYRRAGVFVPKKNRKSSLMSQLAQYLATCHAPAQDVFLAANDRLQARTMYRMVRQSVEASPTLSKLLEVVDSRSIIRNRETGKEIRCLSSDSWRNEGLNGSVILDEIHSFKTSDLVDALIYATRGTANGLVISISTAGDSRNGVGWRWWSDCQLSIADPKANPTFYGLIYAADPADDFSDPKVWRKANPSMGVAFPEDEFEADYLDAKTDPRKFSRWLRYSLNVWEQADNRWFSNPDDWAACAREPAEPLESRPCWIGVDLASNLDLTSVCFAWKEPDGSYYLRWKHYVPEQTVPEREKRDNIPYSTWIRGGWITVTEGARLDHQRIAADLIEFAENHQVAMVGIDPWNAGLIASLLQSAGIEVQAITQRTGTLNTPSRLLEGLLVERRLRHSGDPVAAWAANHVAVYEDTTGCIKPDKQKSTEKIDPIVAAVNALAVASTSSEEPTDWSLIQL
jgi:phage terminase large subunit-like protein